MKDLFGHAVGPGHLSRPRQLIIRLADAYLFTGDAAAALAELQKVLVKDPGNKEAAIVQAHSLLKIS